LAVVRISELPAVAEADVFTPETLCAFQSLADPPRPRRVPDAVHRAATRSPSPSRRSTRHSRSGRPGGTARRSTLGPWYLRCRRRTKILPDIVVYGPSRVLPVAASGRVLQRARPDADVVTGRRHALDRALPMAGRAPGCRQTERPTGGRAAWRSPRVSRRLAAVLLANRGVCRAPVRHLLRAGRSTVGPELSAIKMVPRGTPPAARSLLPPSRPGCRPWGDSDRRRRHRARQRRHRHGLGDHHPRRWRDQFAAGRAVRKG
jgi:hypothetical protein